MVDKISKAARRKTMQAIRSKYTKIENVLVKRLWSRGFRFRRNVNDLYGKPDIAIKKYKFIIFVDSCFWHGCPHHCRLPHSNRKYWGTKIKRNKMRDAEVNIWYKSNGWRALRFWEHDINENIAKCVRKIEKNIKQKPPK